MYPSLGPFSGFLNYVIWYQRSLVGVVIHMFIQTPVCKNPLCHDCGNHAQSCVSFSTPVVSHCPDGCQLTMNLLRSTRGAPARGVQVMHVKSVLPALVVYTWLTPWASYWVATQRSEAGDFMKLSNLVGIFWTDLTRQAG